MIELTAREKALCMIAIREYLNLISCKDDPQKLDAVISEAKRFEEKHRFNVSDLAKLYVYFRGVQDDPVFSMLF